MLINFNPQINKKTNPNFKSLKDGLIDPIEAARNPEHTISYIEDDVYIPLQKNLESLLNAKKIINDNKYGYKKSALEDLEEAIRILLKKALDKGIKLKTNL